MLTPMVAIGQTDSSAARIVDRYLDILNIKALPMDSMLVMTTEITQPGSTDTIVMRRLFQQPQMFLVEVRGSNGLQSALCSDGKTYYRSYSPKYEQWHNLERGTFFSHLTGFDFRGPLYNWRNTGLMMSYRGKVKAQNKGNVELDVVRVEVEGRYMRDYMFEPSGLLSVIVESDSIMKDAGIYEDAHIEWKIIHEYDNIGRTLLPTVESFARDSVITIMRTEMHFEPRNDDKFYRE